MIESVNTATVDSFSVVVRQGGDWETPFIGPKSIRVPPKPKNLSTRTDELVVEFNRQGFGLGLSIAGGCDTILGSVFIHNVLAGGSAAKDGRLRSADRITEVNGVNFEVVEHSKALEILRKVPDKVHLIRHPNSLESAVLKHPGSNLGLAIVHPQYVNGIYISSILQGGLAERTGKFRVGDQLLEVNGIDLCQAAQEEAVTVLKNAQGLLHLRIARRENLERRRVLTQRPKYRTVTLQRNRRGLGFSIIGGACHLKGDLPVIVRSIFPHGPAQQCAALYPGDQIVAVDAIPIDGLTHHEVVDLLQSTGEAVTLTLRS